MSLPGAPIAPLSIHQGPARTSEVFTAEGMIQGIGYSGDEGVESPWETVRTYRRLVRAGSCLRPNQEGQKKRVVASESGQWGSSEETRATARGFPEGAGATEEIQLLSEKRERQRNSLASPFLLPSNPLTVPPTGQTQLAWSPEASTPLWNRMEQGGGGVGNGSESEGA